MMVYQWRLPGLYSVDPQIAGAELEKIYELHGGELKPAAVVEASVPDDAPLHSVFEWDNDKAAVLYRESQAKSLIRAIIVVEDSPTTPSKEVRAFVNVQHQYHPLTIALTNEDMRQELLQQAHRDMRAFQRKYDTLSELSGVFRAMDSVMTEDTVCTT